MRILSQALSSSKDSLSLLKLQASLNDDYRFEPIFGKPST
jgi:hypothetical protein